MWERVLRGRGRAALWGASVTTLAVEVAAAPCPRDLPNSIYGSGSSQNTPTFGAIAAQLSALPEENGSGPIHVFYADSEACAAYDRLARPSESKPATFLYWGNGNAAPVPCEADGSEELSFGWAPDVLSSCPTYAARAPEVELGEFAWAVDVVAFVTGRESKQKSISGEAVAYLFGLGAASAGVTPWSDPTGIFLSSPTSFTRRLVARAIGRPAESFQGDDLRSSGSIRHDVAAWSTYVAAEGALGYGLYFGHEQGDLVRTLAYQHIGQSCGYLPDSSEGTSDRRNVRSGQYALWTQSLLFAKTEGGQIANANVERLLRAVDDSPKAPHELSFIGEIIRSGGVPLCAMNARRLAPESELELGALESFAPEAPCHGYFDFLTTGHAELTRCESDADCSGTEKCRGWETALGDTEPELVAFCEAY